MTQLPEPVIWTPVVTGLSVFLTLCPSTAVNVNLASVAFSVKKILMSVILHLVSMVASVSTGAFYFFIKTFPRNSYWLRTSQKWKLDDLTPISRSRSSLRINTYECQCKLGYTGRNCQIQGDPCLALPCRNDGKCFSVGESYVCQVKAQLFLERNLWVFQEKNQTICILSNELSFSAPHLILGATVRPHLPTAQPTSVETEGSVASEPMVSLK